MLMGVLRCGKDGCFLSDDARCRWYSAYEEEMRTPAERFSGRSPREYIRHEIYTFAAQAMELQKKLGIDSEETPGFAIKRESSP